MSEHRRAPILIPSEVYFIIFWQTCALQLSCVLARKKTVIFIRIIELLFNIAHGFNIWQNRRGREIRHDETAVKNRELKIIWLQCLYSIHHY